MEEPIENMEEVIRRDGRYPPEAFGFLHDGLNYAVEHVHGDAPPEPHPDDPDAPHGRHVTGQELCWALRDLALERWGMLARTVLRRWNLRRTIDFGNMVYLMIEHGFMRKTEEDSIEDFRDVFDFDEALQFQDEFELKE
ncbi:MAG: Minf_1886 family protein [Phycisphaerae bacterium]